MVDSVLGPCRLTTRCSRRSIAARLDASVGPHMAKPAWSPVFASRRLNRSSNACAIVLRNLTQRQYSTRHHG